MHSAYKPSIFGFLKIHTTDEPTMYAKTSHYTWMIINESQKECYEKVEPFLSLKITQWIGIMKFFTWKKFHKWL